MIKLETEEFEAIPYPTNSNSGASATIYDSKDLKIQRLADKINEIIDSLNSQKTNIEGLEMQVQGGQIMLKSLLDTLKK